MPLWQVYHSQGLFTDQDKLEISRQVTDIYARILPRFYVGVVFLELPKTSFYIGGEPAGDFVRLSLDHIARQFDSDEGRQRFLTACTKVLDPYIAARGLRWELHIDETPFELWTINGLRPPPGGSQAEAQWRVENRPSAYDVQ